MSVADFTYSEDDLRGYAQTILEHARRAGASGTECDLSEGRGLTVTVRKGRVDTIEYNRDKSIGVTVYLGERPRIHRGNASTSDFSPAAIRDTVDAALAIARHTAEDDCAGLPDEALLARSPRDLDLYHPWDIDVERATSIARSCEDAAFAVAPAISNSEGATVSVQSGRYHLANSLGFGAGLASTRHSISVSVIAQQRRAMQRDDWYSGDRVPTRLAPPEAIGDYAARRALARLGARRVSTRNCPVLFEAPVAAQLIGSFVSAVSGTSLYRKASFLVDSLGKDVFAPLVAIEERPSDPREFGSAAFDDEGVATKDRHVVRAGRLEGYFLGSYSARKLGMASTGNAGGHHSLRIGRSDGRPGPDFAGMLGALGTGLLVTEMLGHGVNLVTGDYSRGAAGYWVEGGQIAYPVEEITIAGNLRDIFRGIVEIGGDVIQRGARRCGSILVDRMTIAGD